MKEDCLDREESRQREWMETIGERKKKNLYYEISGKPNSGTAHSGLESLLNEFLHYTLDKE